MYCAPEAIARLATVMCEFGVPLPGANVPPLSTVTLPTEPPPISVPPTLTLTWPEAASEPSTSSVPPLTVVAPV